MYSNLLGFFVGIETALRQLSTNTVAIEKTRSSRKQASGKRLPALLFLMLCSAALSVQAANPSAGTVSPSPGDYTHWYGTQSTGSASIDESTCVEDVNCDTFTLTVSGNPSDWVGKHARLSIFWGERTSDYDVYIHKDTNEGALVAKSAHGATDSDNFEEVIILDPATSGTGVYSIHVVYFATTNGSIYIGDVTVSNNTVPEPTPTPTPTPELTPTPTPVPPPTPEPVEHDPSAATCTLPGFKVAEDETGDSASGLAAHDLESLWIAEPGNLTNKVVFTIKVADLSVVPPNSEWRVDFESYYFDFYWVSMNTTDPVRGAVFYYGHYEYASGVRKSFTDGEADAGEYLADGTIRITIAHDKFAHFGAGRRIYAPYAHIHAFNGLPFVGLNGEMDTHRSSQSYLVVGNLSCDYLPSVSINSPQEGEVFAPGSVIRIGADAADSDGTISKVEFFANDAKLGESNTSPYSFNWTNAPVGSYTLTARATDNVGGSATSAPVRIEVRVPPPAAPASLTATSLNGAGKGIVTLRWSDQSANEQLFHVERSTSPVGGFAEIATVAANVTTYADSTVERKTTYYYRVRASNGGGFSAYSNTASVSVK
ncbi:MAG TPA: Ig-like domain-containing protein [Pyrinomonadaceae bacterium]|nr:Ig-like domain-containing protein [Pyrinomonadaceae bacterium]